MKRGMTAEDGMWRVRTQKLSHCTSHVCLNNSEKEPCTTPEQLEHIVCNIHYLPTQPSLGLVTQSISTPTVSDILIDIVLYILCYKLIL